MTDHVVTLPNGDLITSLYQATLKDPNLPPPARDVFIFNNNDLSEFNLLSVPQLTKTGLVVTFRKDVASVQDPAGSNILTAHRDPVSDLYFVDKEPKLAVLFPKSAKINQKVAFYSAAMGSPANSTLADAITNNWIQLPGLTASMVRNQPQSESTSKGHLDRIRAGLDSTHNSHMHSPLPTQSEETELKQSIYIDLTGRFPHTSVRGNEYLMCTRCSDSKYIHIELLKSRDAKEIVAAFEKTARFFNDHGIQHSKLKLDNETSELFRQATKGLKIKMEFVPPDNHRQNPAERDIRTFKNHLIASLATTDPDFPINQWDLIIPQVEMTLNLMRGSPTLGTSSYEHLWGVYDYNRNPIAPIGTKVIILEDPDHRKSWAPHGVKGFYVGPAMEHYRAFKILVSETDRVRITDSVSWHPREHLQYDFSDIRSQIHLPSPTASNPSHFDPPLSIVVPDPPLSIVQLNDSIIHSTSPSPTTTIESISPAGSPISPPTPLSDGPPKARKSTSSSAPQRSTTRTRKPNPRYLDMAFRFAGTAKSFKSACKGPDQALWMKAAAEEFDRLIEETSTMKFVPWNAKPSGRKVSYYNPQIRIKTKPDGSLTYRVRGTYGGDISDYHGPTAAQTADMTSIKILWNATVSEEAEFMSIDIKDFYLGTKLEQNEYMRIHISQIPQESRDKYVTPDLIQDDHVLAEISKGIYGLKQAGLLAQQRLVQHLSKHDFFPISAISPCIFKHKTRNIVFSLVVDDFGVKFKAKEDVEELLRVLRLLYVVKEDWTGSAYVGFKIQHDHNKGTLSISMPNYIKDAAERFHIDISKKIDNPLLSDSGDSNQPSQPVTPQQEKRLQQIIGVLLYYARAVDPIALTRISKISSQQKKATVATLKAAERVLQYLATQPEASITYHKCSMRLICYSDASYQGESKARSRCGGVFFLGDNNVATFNGPILSRSSIIDSVTSSAAESELAAAFMNAREAVYFRAVLEGLGYPQERTPLITDNSFVYSLVNGTCKAKRSRAMDMRYNWLLDRTNRDQFEIIWCKGQVNIADHLTKDLQTYQLKALKKLLVEATDSSTSSRSLFKLLSQEKVASIDPLPQCESGGCVHELTEKSLQDPSSIQPFASLPRTEEMSLFVKGCLQQPY